MNKLDDLDRNLLDIMQNQFPIAVDPFQDIADKLGISFSDAVQRIESLKEKGIIRRIGAIIDASKVGYKSTLCACKMPEHIIGEFAETVESISYITHNYVRNHEFNIWFTITTPTVEERGIIIKELEEAFHIIISCMPAEKVYKIRVSLGMERDNGL